MFSAFATIYLFIKLVFFFSLVRIQVKSDAMKDHFLFLGILYTAGIAVISYVYLMGWQDFQWPPWQYRIAATLGVTPRIAWLGESLVLSTLYFWLMARFDEGVIFWTLLLLGVPFVVFC
jgi:hypothetical protein